MLEFGADEVVVAKISKRVPMKIGTSEGLHIVSIGKVLQVQKTMILLIKHNPLDCTMKSRMNREVHVRFCERFRGEIPLYLLDLKLNQY
jgi:hypothetical protein